MKQLTSKGFGRDFKTGILPITTLAMHWKWNMWRYILLATRSIICVNTASCLLLYSTASAFILLARNDSERQSITRSQAVARTADRTASRTADYAVIGNCC